MTIRLLNNRLVEKNKRLTEENTHTHPNKIRNDPSLFIMGNEDST